MSELDPRLQKHLHALHDVPPRDPQRAADGRAQFLRMAEEMKPQDVPRQAVSFGPFWRLKEWIQPKPQTQKEGLKMANLVIALLMAVSVVFGGGAAAAYASQDALPGDTLYPVKTAVEQAEIAITTDAQTQAELHLELAQERAAEIQALAAEGRLDLIPETAEDMQLHLQQAEQLAQQLAQEGNQEAVARVMVMSQVTEQMLQRAMTQAPPEAQQALAYAAQMAEHARTQAQQHAAEAQAQAEQMAQEANQTMTQTQEQIQERTQTRLHDFQPFNLSGQIESMDGETWVVDGQIIIVPEDAVIAGDVTVGDTVQIHGYIDPEGNFVAVQVYPIGEVAIPDAIPVRFSGIVESIDGETWTISGQQVTVNEATIIEDEIAVDDTVMVKAQLLPDGSLIAIRIELMDKTLMQPQVVSFQGIVESQTDNTWIVAGQTVAIDNATEIHGTPQVNDRVLVVAEVQEDGSLTAKVINLIARHNGQPGNGQPGNGQIQQPPMPPTEIPNVQPEPSETQDSFWNNMWPTETPDHNEGHH